MGHVGPISTRSLDEILGYISPLSHMGSEGLRSLNRGILTLFGAILGLFWSQSWEPFWQLRGQICPYGNGIWRVLARRAPKGLPE